MRIFRTFLYHTISLRDLSPSLIPFIGDGIDNQKLLEYYRQTYLDSHTHTSTQIHIRNKACTQTLTSAHAFAQTYTYA